jgi:hypothetical protein
MLNEIKIEVAIIFENIEILFDAINENEFNSIKGGFIIWKHFYHFIHSIDKYLINPHNYIEPSFHREDTHITNLKNDTPMGKIELKNYYNNVKDKINKYINSLTEDGLNEIVFIDDDGNSVSKGGRILGVIRHTYYHIGYLHCCVKTEKGETPEYLNVTRYYEKIKK